MITFDPKYSIELCGGCHVSYTGEIGWFKISSESAIAAGVRRIEAVTARKAESYIEKKLAELNDLQSALNNNQNSRAALEQIIQQNKSLQKQIEKIAASQAQEVKKQLLASKESHGDYHLIAQRVELLDGKSGKNILFQLTKENPDTLVILGIETDGKAQLLIGMDKALSQEHSLDAGTMIKAVASEIRGGGGGQAFFASAGGAYPQGLDTAIDKAKSML